MSDSGYKRVRAYAPGRTELAGNHTDHQGGRVIAATVGCGVEMVVEATGGDEALVASEGFPTVRIGLADVGRARHDERFSTAALVRGVVAGLMNAGVPVAGFSAVVRSSVPAGSGLSSSSAFELALVRGLELLFAGGCPLAAADAARMGQAAERDYFGKPCGLMDQLSIALGGVNCLDFGGGRVGVEPIAFDFSGCGYDMYLIDTHCDHSSYTDDYALVAQDMDAVARYLGAAALSEVPAGRFLDKIGAVRHDMGDLPALRALHYYNEMALVDERADSLRRGDFPAFLGAMRRSGTSSAQFLQNVSTADRCQQPAMVVLALADYLLAGQGAARIHGGGFGGTVQAFVPHDRSDVFVAEMDCQLGAGSCHRYGLADEGAHAEWL